MNADLKAELVYELRFIRLTNGPDQRRERRNACRPVELWLVDHIVDLGADRKRPANTPVCAQANQACNRILFTERPTTRIRADRSTRHERRAGVALRLRIRTGEVIEPAVVPLRA